MPLDIGKWKSGVFRYMAFKEGMRNGHDGVNELTVEKNQSSPLDMTQDLSLDITSYLSKLQAQISLICSLIEKLLRTVDVFSNAACMRSM